MASPTTDGYYELLCIVRGFTLDSWTYPAVRMCLLRMLKYVTLINTHASPCPLQALLDWYEEQVGDLFGISSLTTSEGFSSFPPGSSPPAGTTRDTRLRALRDESADGGGGGGSISVAAAAEESATREAVLQLQRNHAGRPVVLIVEAAESADPDSLQDLILILSEVSSPPLPLFPFPPSVLLLFLPSSLLFSPVLPFLPPSPYSLILPPTRIPPPTTHRHHQQTHLALTLARLHFLVVTYL